MNTNDIKYLKAKFINENKICIKIIDNEDEVLIENQEFEKDDILSNNDRLVLAILVTLGFDVEEVLNSELLKSYVEDDEIYPEDIMNFYDKKTAFENAEKKTLNAMEALRKEKEQMDENRK